MAALILFASSRRHGNTGALADALAAQLHAEVVDLGRLQIAPYDYEHRNRDDDFEPLMQRVLASDWLVFASPIYWYSCAAPMKLFLDRISDLLDIPELLESGRRLRGKTACVACTSVRDEASPHFVGAFADTFAYLGMRFGGLVHVKCADDQPPPDFVRAAREFVHTARHDGR